MLFFLKQPAPSSCGPVVVCNSAKWANAPEITLDHAHILCECDDDNGTAHDKIDSTLRYALRGYASIKRIKYPTYECIFTHIKRPYCAAVITMMYDAHEGHSTLLTSAKNDTFWAVNFIPGEARVARPIEYLQCVLSIKRECTDGHHYPHAWLLKRK